MNRRGFVFYAKPARRRAFVIRMLPRSSIWAEPVRTTFTRWSLSKGETLENLIKRSGRLEVKLALEIATQVAAGLAAVHKQKLVHRDIKPSNIMVSVEEEDAVTAKIIDLGLAKPASDAAAEAAISTPGAFAGTPEFASPEQFAGVGVDIRSDLYSLGVVLWEMVTGRRGVQGLPGRGDVSASARAVTAGRTRTPFRSRSSFSWRSSWRKTQPGVSRVRPNF